MLKPSEKKQVAENLARFFQTFQSSRTIEPEVAVYFIEDVSEFSLRAIEDTISAFRRGEIENRNNAFAPSVAEFVAEVRTRQDRLQSQEILDNTTFIEAETAIWRAICERRGGSMPRIERNGVTGWYVPTDEVERVPAQAIEKYRVLLENRQPLAVVPQLQRMNDHG